MEFQAMRALLQEAQEELGGMLEEGLLQAGRRDSLLCLAEAFRNAGMEWGDVEIKALSAALTRLRLDPAADPRNCALVFSRIWRYLSLCGRELEYLQAEAAMKESEHTSTDYLGKGGAQ